MTEHDLARQLVERGIVPGDPTAAEDWDGHIYDGPGNFSSPDALIHRKSRVRWVTSGAGWAPDLDDDATVGVLHQMLLDRVVNAVCVECYDPTTPNPWRVSWDGNGYADIASGSVEDCASRGEAIARALIEVSQ